MRIALVVPRYGPEIGGGAEGLARWFAQSLAQDHQVTVLTTTALDYMTWAPHYATGSDRDGSVGVLRFPVPVKRDVAAFNRLNEYVLESDDIISTEVEERWMVEQGPVSPALLDHLGQHGDGYDAVLFIPYLYATTGLGLPLVADRSVLIPALHDEAPAYLSIMRRTFRLAKGIGFLTPEERELAGDLFGRCGHHRSLLGIGIDTPQPTTPERDMVPDRPYVLYVGRIDPSKGSLDLFSHHRALLHRHHDAPMLVLAGRAVVEVPDVPWIRHVGYVSEAEKAALIKGAVCSVLPSPYESLSISILEAWSHARPVIVSSRSKVLVGQARRANGGLWFDDAAGYADAVMMLARDPRLGAQMGEHGRLYTIGRYRTAAVVDRLERLVHSAASGAA